MKGGPKRKVTGREEKRLIIIYNGWVDGKKKNENNTIWV
jgi:hypothetical protein